MHFVSILRFNFRVLDLFCHTCESQKFNILLSSTERKVFRLHPLSQYWSSQPLFLVSFEPILWFLPKSLQFSTTSSSMNTLTQYLLQWLYLEKKGGLHVLISLSSALTCHLQNPITAGNVPCIMPSFKPRHPQKPFQNFDLWDHIPILGYLFLYSGTA